MGVKKTFRCRTSSPSGAHFSLVRRAFSEFLTVPLAMLFAAIVFAAFTLYLDRADVTWLAVGRQYLSLHLFQTAQGTASLLGTLLSGMLTLISITFSVLLLAVQQTASTLSNQVYDQFLRRRFNQVYFGYSVGLAVYTLLVLAAVGRTFNPVYSASCLVVLSIGGLVLLILLIYGAVYQMRPEVIIQAMHDHTLRARERQQTLIRRTLRETRSPYKKKAEVTAEQDGFLADVNIDTLQDAGSGKIEIEIVVPIGTYAACGDLLAVIRAASPDAARSVVPAVRQALRLEHDRDLSRDPAWGIVELENIAWTTASSAKSTPEPPRLVINALRDLLTRWSEQKCARGAEFPLPIVYHDNVERQALDALATIAIGAKESLQNVVMIEALRAFGLLYERGEEKLQVTKFIRYIIPALRSLVLTPRLEETLHWLYTRLYRSGETQLASEINDTMQYLSNRVGHVSNERTRGVGASATLSPNGS